MLNPSKGSRRRREEEGEREREREREREKTRARTMRVLDWLGWKASPKKQSQTALKGHVLESNGEGGSKAGLEVAVEKDD